MNWDRIEGNWKQLKGSVKAQWGRLSDHQHFDVMPGKRENLAGEGPGNVRAAAGRMPRRSAMCGNAYRLKRHLLLR